MFNSKKFPYHEAKISNFHEYFEYLPKFPSEADIKYRHTHLYIHTCDKNIMESNLLFTY